MKKRLLAGLLAAAMTMSLAACGSSSDDAAADTASDSGAAEESAADSDVAYIRNKGALIVGITDFEPMDYKDASGNWIGFDADMATKVADSLGVSVEFVEIDWDNKILELDNKSIDVVWNGMTLTNEVKSAMECSNAYLNNAQVVVAKSDIASTLDSSSAAELAYAVEAGSAGEAAAQDNGYDFTSVTTQADAVMEVAAGTSDACIIDLLMAGAMIGEGTSYPELAASSVELTTEEYGVGCRKGSDLAAYINDQFKALYADGTMNTIAETYGVQYAILAQ